MFSGNMFSSKAHPSSSLIGSEDGKITRTEKSPSRHCSPTNIFVSLKCRRQDVEHMKSMPISLVFLGLGRFRAVPNRTAERTRNGQQFDSEQTRTNDDDYDDHDGVAIATTTTKDEDDDERRLVSNRLRRRRTQECHNSEQIDRARL